MEVLYKSQVKFIQVLIYFRIHFPFLFINPIITEIKIDISIQPSHIRTP